MKRGRVMSEENKALARKFLRMFERGEPNMADEIVAADYTNHDAPDPVIGLAGIKAGVAAFKKAFPDAQVKIAYQHAGFNPGCDPFQKSYHPFCMIRKISFARLMKEAESISITANSESVKHSASIRWHYAQPNRMANMMSFFARFRLLKSAFGWIIVKDFMCYSCVRTPVSLVSGLYIENLGRGRGWGCQGEGELKSASPNTSLVPIAL
jgi:hypothetical protein